MRTIASSVRAPELVACLLGAIALAFALPKAGQSWLAPLGAAALFWAWERLPLKRAFFAGWFAGAVYFAISYAWFTYTVGSYVGGFAFAIVVIPAGVHGLTFALTALGTRFTARYAPPAIVPLAGAAAFTVLEWWRSIGIVGIPFAQVGYSQTETLLGVFAAYVGAFGVTFVVVLLGAYGAYAVTRRDVRALGTVCAVVAVGWILCYALWPARNYAAATMKVAAVQGNIPQSLKSSNVDLSIQRYTQMTLRLRAFRPQLVVWPETVILTVLNDTPQTLPQYFSVSTAASDRKAAQQYIDRGTALSRQFGHLADTLHTTLAAGSLDRHIAGEGIKPYNAIYVYGQSGALQTIYDKTQLVPFAETLPAPALMSHLPYADLIGRYGHGTDDAVIPVAGGLSFAPLICWESAFSDVVHTRLARGAQFLVIPTDDAWFGPSSGTYQHAQIAQMRAIESGEWVLQAASTGISGTIAPDGRWIDSLQLDRQGNVESRVGAPSGSVFAKLGPTPVGIAAMLVFAAILCGGMLARRS